MIISWPISPSLTISSYNVYMGVNILALIYLLNARLWDDNSQTEAPTYLLTSLTLRLYLSLLSLCISLLSPASLNSFITTASTTASKRTWPWSFAFLTPSFSALYDTGSGSVTDITMPFLLPDPPPSTSARPQIKVNFFYVLFSLSFFFAFIYAYICSGKDHVCIHFTSAL